MGVEAWFRRLWRDCPGWHFWYTSGGGMPRGWYAVPAPADTDHTAALALPGRIFAKTPAELRTLAREGGVSGE